MVESFTDGSEALQAISVNQHPDHAEDRPAVTPTVVAMRRYPRDRRRAVVLFGRPDSLRGRGQRDALENRAGRASAPVSGLLIRSRSPSPFRRCPTRRSCERGPWKRTTASRLSRGHAAWRRGFRPMGCARNDRFARNPMTITPFRGQCTQFPEKNDARARSPGPPIDPSG